ncbi:hypothetical protein GCM10011395_35390 [Sphingomonas psychrolutea]|uniref:Uncharacterized protein n=1 Tax=Sphingomonas psychrolutea TaxID=1259676 RepID=A0ABQ1H8X2_9SPHN|nr:hypothetical protein GCM10011395_35390 [Sphingomonas psychrolutea]
MAASVQDTNATRSEAQATRAPWQPLGFEKVAAADAKGGTGTFNPGDANTYS